MQQWNNQIPHLASRTDSRKPQLLFPKKERLWSLEAHSRCRVGSCFFHLRRNGRSKGQCFSKTNKRPLPSVPFFKTTNRISITNRSWKPISSSLHRRRAFLIKENSLADAAQQQLPLLPPKRQRRFLLLFDTKAGIRCPVCPFSRKTRSRSLSSFLPKKNVPFRS
jgi:hypothetical protein